MADAEVTFGEDFDCLHLLDELHEISCLEVVVKGSSEGGWLSWTLFGAGQGDDLEDDFAGDVFGGVAAEWEEGYMASNFRAWLVYLMISWFLLRL